MTMMTTWFVPSTRTASALRLPQRYARLPQSTRTAFSTVPRGAATATAATTASWLGSSSCRPFTLSDRSQLASSFRSSRSSTAAFSSAASSTEVSDQAVQAARQSSLEGRTAYNVSQTWTGPTACAQAGIDVYGITKPTTIYRNLQYEELFQHEVKNKEGVVAKAEYGDTFVVDTGKYTGRSPKDRWIVLNPGSETAENIDWNNINQPTSPQVFDELYDKAVAHFNTRDDCYVFDGYCGANPETRKKIRFVHEMYVCATSTRRSREQNRICLVGISDNTWTLPGRRSVKHSNNGGNKHTHT